MSDVQTLPVEKTDWGVFRKEMPVTEQWAYLDHAAVAPLSGPAYWAVAHWNADAAANGDAFYQGWIRQLNEGPGSGRPNQSKPSLRKLLWSPIRPPESAW